ncbi:MAG: diol dehydratase small subunit [Dehalobacterium sp.]|jgi:propanediol dehydratase small subunit
MDEKQLEAMVREVLQYMGQSPEKSKSRNATSDNQKLTAKDFPLTEKRRDLIKSRTGKKIDDLTLDAVMKGEVTFKDFAIDPQVLEYQAQIAESMGRNQIAENLRRSMELTTVPDEEVLSLYNALRPYRSTKDDLLSYADHLEKTYQAAQCAQLFREAAEIYEKRGMLNQD